MSLTEYEKTISTDFPNGVVNSTSLLIQIQSSSITIAVDRIDTLGDVCSIWFRDELSPADETVLNTIIANHSGVPTEVVPKVQIKEEYVETGEHFGCITMKIDASGGTMGIGSLSFPFNVSVMSVTFVSDQNQVDDTLSLLVGPRTIVGYITNFIVPATAWSSQEYTVGNKVTFTHPIFGPRVYTCTVDTSGNQNPTDTSHWIHGYEIPVSPTVISNSFIGFYMDLVDGAQYDNLGRIIAKRLDKIYVENNITHTFSPLTPTYVRQTVYTIKDYQMGKAAKHLIGDKKIGGSHLPKDTIVEIEYMNNGTEYNYLVGVVEYLY